VFIEAFVASATIFGFWWKFRTDAKFRKTIIGMMKECQKLKEDAKDAEEKLEPATTNTVSTVVKT